MNEPPVAVGSIGTQTAVVNQAFSLSLAGKIVDPDGASTANGALTYTLSGTLPSGLLFNSTSLTVAGTPTTGSAAATFTLTGTDGEFARDTLRGMIVRLGEAASTGVVDPRQTAKPFVEAILEIRRIVRAEKRYDLSDVIRDALAAAGVEVRDAIGA